MAKYRDARPHLAGGMFLTDGGLETDLIFHEGFEMPLFASFPLLKNEAGRTALRSYYLRYAQVATEAQVGFILEAATWRASRDWAVQLGYSSALLADANRRAVTCSLRSEWCWAKVPVPSSSAPRWIRRGWL